MGRTTSIQDQDGTGTSLASFLYAYDAAGRVTSQTENGTTVTYTYDSTNQLTADGTSTFTYDGTGNRTNTGYSTGTGNQLLADGTYTYSYDAEGNLTGKTRQSDGDNWSYTYDNLNELTQAVEKTTTALVEQTVNYKYGPMQERLEKAVTTGSTVTSRYGYDGWKSHLDLFGNPASYVDHENWDVWVDMDGANALQTRYLRGDEVDQLFAREGSDNAVYWILGDSQGSTRTVLDNSGVVKDYVTYDGWGNATQTNASFGGRYLWTGREWDVETGLQYNRARYYDPHAGRWISQDPLGFEAGDSNLYRYTTNTPTTSADPSGLWQIFRRGDALAAAYPGHGDTIGELADTIGLDAASFRSWLTFPSVKTGMVLVDGSVKPLSQLTPSDKLCADQTVLIPNTVYSLWIGWGKNFGRWGVSWRSNLEYLERLGFHVPELNYDTIPIAQRGTAPLQVFQTLSGLSRAKALHGFFVWGHGAKSDDSREGQLRSDDDRFVLNYSTISRGLDYKMALMIMDVCHGVTAKPWLASKSQGVLFAGRPGKILPFINMYHTWNVIKPGAQGTNPNAKKPIWGWPGNIVPWIF